MLWRITCCFHTPARDLMPARNATTPANNLNSWRDAWKRTVLKSMSWHLATVWLQSSGELIWSERTCYVYCHLSLKYILFCEYMSPAPVIIFRPIVVTPDCHTALPNSRCDTRTSLHLERFCLVQTLLGWADAEDWACLSSSQWVAGGSQSRCQRGCAYLRHSSHHRRGPLCHSQGWNPLSGPIQFSSLCDSNRLRTP